MAKKRPANQIEGIFIYKYKNLAVYRGPITKTAHMINNNDVALYDKWDYRYLVVIISIAVITFLTSNILIALAAGLVIYIISYILYRLLFINKLPVLDGFEVPKKESFFVTTAHDYSTKRLVAIVLLAYLSIPLLMINALKNGTELYTIFGWCASGVFFIFGTIYLISLIIKIKK